MLVVQFTSAHLPTLKAMQVFRIWISAQRTQLSTFILTRYLYNTSLTKMSPRQDRLADDIARLGFPPGSFITGVTTGPILHGQSPDGRDLKVFNNNIGNFGLMRAD